MVREASAVDTLVTGRNMKTTYCGLLVYLDNLSVLVIIAYIPLTISFFSHSDQISNCQSLQHID